MSRCPELLTFAWRKTALCTCVTRVRHGSGTNENTNRLLRQYYPRSSTDFRGHPKTISTASHVSSMSNAASLWAGQPQPRDSTTCSMHKHLTPSRIAQGSPEGAIHLLPTQSGTDFSAPTRRRLLSNAKNESADRLVPSLEIRRLLPATPYPARHVAFAEK